MATLNQLSSRIAHIVNQSDNHVLKERIKDMVKDMFANRIRQSIEKHGIDDTLKLTFAVNVKSKGIGGIIEGSQLPVQITTYISENKIPIPVRIISDAPFTNVYDYRDGKSFQYVNSITEFKMRIKGRPTLPPTGGVRVYTLINNYLIIYGYDDGPVQNVHITGIFENPEEVLTYYNGEDGGDIELPLPSDMIEEIIATILKVEFNLIPKDEDIKFVANSPIVTKKDK
jgi:hypothetical protein